MTAGQALTPLPTWPAPAGHPALAGVLRPRPSGAPRHVHVVPSLSLGGAERIVLDLAASSSRAGVPMDVVVLRDVRHAHAAPALPGITYHLLGGLPWERRMAEAADAIRASGIPGYCHLTRGEELAMLWGAGVETVPVVHNARDGWRHSPSAWSHPLVPFVVACGDAVADDLASAGCPAPVVTLRHLPPEPEAMPQGRRTAVRAALGAGDGTLLLGMTGRVVPQKDHARAVGVLAELRGRGVDARLVVLGAHDTPEGRPSHRAAVDAAVAAGVRDSLLFLGPVGDAGRLVRAFDVHLNTSRYEGVSIATMEAVAGGVPVVSADVGGQREALGVLDESLPAGATAAEYADAVIRVSGRGPVSPPRHRRAFVDANAIAWPWASTFRGARFRAAAHVDDVLFVTGNLDVGGAQRSLCLLAAEMSRRGRRVTVAVCGRFGVPGFVSEPARAGVGFLDLCVGGGPAGRIGAILSTVAERKPRALAFWNMDAVTKAAVAKALSGSPVRVAEASPGPALMRELEEARADLSLLSTDPGRYLGHLDAFAAKYDGGLPASGLSAAARKAVIPNGVPVAAPLPDGEGPRPPDGADPGLSVLVVGRLNATKKVGLLPAIADGLAARVPGATVTVVGGVHGGTTEAVAAPASGSLRFLPPDTRSLGFAGRFACLLMLSTEQGCPNTSLEAMSAGIPVVANDDGGTREQVLDGLTGRLLRAEGDEALAEAAVEALAGILADRDARLAMGHRARAHAGANFTVGSMADGYDSLLLG